MRNVAAQPWMTEKTPKMMQAAPVPAEQMAAARTKEPVTVATANPELAP